MKNVHFAVKKTALHDPDNSLIAKVHAMINHNLPRPTDCLQPNRPEQRIVGEKLKGRKGRINRQNSLI